MQKNNLIAGGVWTGLLLFALPLFGSSLIQQLYNTVSLIFVGQLLGKEAAAAVGASSLLITCLVGFFTGISVGSGVVAARFFGANDKRSLHKTVHTALFIGFAGGIVLTILGYVFTPVLLGWMNTPGDIFAQAVAYLRPYFFSLTPLIVYNMGAGVLRALGNSKAPMMYQLVGGVSNVVTHAVFIWGLGWGLTGAAIAILVSQGIAAGLVLWHLTTLDDAYQLRYRDLAVDTGSLKMILLIGIPAGIQAMVITLSNLIVQYHINSLGVDSIAAFTAYFKVELFIYLPILAFGQAATTFVSMNVGARRMDRVRKGVRASLLMSILTTIALTVATLLLSGPAFGLFSDDAAVIALGGRLALVTFPFYFLYAVLEVLASTVRGAGKAIPPMVIILLNFCLARTLLIYLAMYVAPSAVSVAAVYPLTWAGAALCLVIYYAWGNWRPVVPNPPTA